VPRSTVRLLQHGGRSLYVALRPSLGLDDDKSGAACDEHEFLKHVKLTSRSTHLRHARHTRRNSYFAAPCQRSPAYSYLNADSLPIAPENPHSNETITFYPTSKFRVAARARALRSDTAIERVWTSFGAHSPTSRSRARSPL
jgi:hypothetical protein